MSNKKLNAVITIGGAISSTFKSVVGTTTSQLHKIGSEVSKLKSSQQQLGNSIQTFGLMGKNVDNLRSRYSSVTAELKKLESQQIRLNKIEKERLTNNEKLTHLKGQIGSAVATVVSMGAPVKTAIDFETAMLGVAKQLDGARDKAGNLTKDFFNMQTEILRVADNSPVARNEIAEMVSAGLRMGVAKNEVVRFTQEVIEMGTAFELPMGQLADDMGKIGNMYKIPITQIGKLADTINYLDDNSLSKGGDIIDFMQRVGGTASMVKITEKNTAALGSTLLSLGEKSETASTAVNAVFSKLGAANTGSKSFRKMVTEIGLSTVELEKGMQTNATDTIFKVMDAIRKLPKEASMEKVWVPPKMSKDGKKQLKGGYYAETPATTQIDAVSTLFGAEHWDTVSKLLENRGELQKQITMANSKDAQGSMDKEYQARMKTTQAQIDVFKNRIGRLGVEFGSVLLPVVNDVLGSVGKFTTKISEWSQKNPQLTSAIAKTVVVLGTFKVGLLGLKFVSILTKSKLLDITGIFTKLSDKGLNLGKVFKFLKSPILGTGARFLVLKNKIISVAASIIRFATSGKVLRTAFSKIGNIGKKAFNLIRSGLVRTLATFGRFKSVVGGAVRSIIRFATSGKVLRTVFRMALTIVRQVGLALLRTPWGVVAALAIGAALLIYKHWDKIKAFFSGFWEGLKKGIEPFTTAVSDLVESTPILGKAWDLVSSAVSKVWDWFTKLLTPVKSSKEEIDGAKDTGVRFGELVGKALSLVLTPLVAIVDLFKWIFNFGGKVFEWIGKIGSAEVAPKITPTVIAPAPQAKPPQLVQAKPPMQIPMQVPKLQMPKLGSSLGESFFKKQNDQSVILNQFNRSEANSNFRTVNNNQTYSQQEIPVPKSVQPYLLNKEQTKTVRNETPQQSQAPSITQHFSFSISAAPNQSPQQIADEVIRKFKQQQGVEQRNSMVDWGYSQ